MTTLNTEILDLKKTELFQNFPDNILQCLSLMSEVIQYDKNEIIFFENQVSEHLYILIEGRVEKYNTSKTELIKSVASLNEICFLSRALNRCSARAKTSSVCIKIDYNTVIETLNTSSESATHIIKYLAKRIHDFT